MREVQTDKGGTVWVSFYKGLYFSDDGFKTIKPYVASDGSLSFQNESITTFYFGGDGKMYLGSKKNVVIALGLSDGTKKQISLSSGVGEPIFVRCLYLYSADERWIGTETGIYI